MNDMSYGGWGPPQSDVDGEGLQHFRCTEHLKESFAAVGIEIAMSEIPPLVRNALTMRTVCRHGIAIYYEPTTDQIVKWRGGRGGAE